MLKDAILISIAEELDNLPNFTARYDDILGYIFCKRSNAKDDTEFIIVLADGLLRIFLQGCLRGVWHTRYESPYHGGETRLITDIPLAFPNAIDLMLNHLNDQYL